MTFFEVIISPRAHSDIADCVSFLLNVSQKAAEELYNKIYDTLDLLSCFPEKNPVFEMNKAFPQIVRKQIIDKRYIALYIIEKEKIVVLRVLDSRRKFQSLL